MYEEYYFKRWGHGQKSIVYLHHFGGAGLTWQWIARSMGSAYSHYAIDIPGFGSSSAVAAPSLAEIADAVQEMVAGLPLSSEAYLVAHSFGAKLAMEMLARHGTSRWRKIVLAAPSAPTVDPMSNKEIQRLLVHPNRGAAEDNVRRSIHIPISPDKFQLAVETQLMADPATWRWWLDVGINQPVSLRPGMIPKPVTVLTSQRDPVIPSNFSQREILKIIPHADFITHASAGHLLPLEDDPWFARQLLRLFGTTPKTTTDDTHGFSSVV